MSTYPLLQVDAFTEQRFHGNPCAVVLDADGLSDALMQTIALEMNLSETAFARRLPDGRWAARYFTPSSEIPFAGHPTLATTWALIESGRVALRGESDVVTLELKKGPIRVDVQQREGRAPLMTMTQARPTFLATLSPEEVMPAFGLSAGDLLPGAPIQVVSTGTPQLMIPVRDHAALRRMQLDAAAYVALRTRAGFFSPHAFCLGGATPAGRTFARHLGVFPDTSEDPFTGSATGGMAAYLWHHGLLAEPRFTAEQGHWMNRPGQALVEVVGPREDIQAVKVGGSAVTVFTGSLAI
jgi:trans-2,3-dihydro-3-hydroxyanthranilate isomerase